LYKGGRLLEVFQSKLLLNLIWLGLGWPLLAGGRCLEVAVNTGLTVFICYWSNKTYTRVHYNFLLFTLDLKWTEE
jgi:hypothetical protein